MQTICDNAGWCWYQDPRLIICRETGNAILASIAGSGGMGGKVRKGDAQVTSFNPQTGEASTVVIGGVLSYGTSDDHNVPALWQRPDGRFLVMHTGHNQGREDKQPKSFYRVSIEPYDASAWGPEKIFHWPTHDPVGNGSVAVTYSNLHFLADEGDDGVLYNIGRGSGQTWQITTSEDWGETWTYRGLLSLPPEGGRAYSNGYPKFCNNGLDRIDFIITEAHPRDYNNGVYHGYIKGGKTHDTAGNVIDPDTFSEQAPKPEEFTALFTPGEQSGNNRHTAWTVAIARDANNDLYALYTARIGTRSVRALDQTINPIGDAHHGLYYAKLVGDSWESHEVCEMGRGLYKPESDYTGLAAIDPRDGSHVIVSTNHDPSTGQRIPQHDLFHGQTTDNGASWRWRRLTEEDVEDYLRPLTATLKDGRLLVAALHGDYFTMHDYNQRMVVTMLE